jgi:hypothetical protein
MIARSQTGNLAHKLGLWSDVVTRFLDLGRKTWVPISPRLGSTNSTSENRPRQNSHLPGNIVSPQLRPAYASENYCDQYVGFSDKWLRLPLPAEDPKAFLTLAHARAEAQRSPSCPGGKRSL